MFIHIFFYLLVAIMAGGGGKPQNIFKLNRGDDPKEVLNWRLWFAVFSFGIMGAARGEFWITFPPLLGWFHF